METQESDLHAKSPIRLVKYKPLERGDRPEGTYGSGVSNLFVPNNQAQYSNEAFQSDNNQHPSLKDPQLQQQQAQDPLSESQNKSANNNGQIHLGFYEVNLANNKNYAKDPPNVQQFIIGEGHGPDNVKNQKIDTKHQVHLSHLAPPFEIVWRDLKFQVDERAFLSGGLSQITKRLTSALFCPPSPSTSNENTQPTKLNNGRETSSMISEANSDSLSKKSLARYRAGEGQQSHHQQVKPQGSLNIAKKKRVIFKNLNGCIRSGEITAILGPSGAGKTSLLNALTGKTEGYRGQVDIIGAQDRRMRLSIIPQKDYLVETLTIRENLIFASKIKNYQKDFDHESNIERVIDMLNLRTCVNAMAGNISGGEHKRVSIAQELLSNPDLLILDEPTSGLDSLNCKKLISTLQGLIQSSKLGMINPIAIVMTIHQPEVDVYHMFDHVYFMARQGRVIFDGPPGDALNVVRQYSGLDDSITDSVYSPANYLIEIASEEYGNKPIDHLANYQRQQFHERNDRLISLRQQHHQQQHGGKNNKSKQLIPYSQHYDHGEAGHVQRQQTTNDHSIVLSVADINVDTNINQLSSLSDMGPGSPSSSASTISTTSSSIDDDNSNSTAISSSSTTFIRDKRLNAKTNHDGHFWRHVKLLTKRAFVSTLRDPLLTTTTAVFHLFIPFVMYIVYSAKTGKVNACPIIQRELDTMTLISNETSDKLYQLQEDFIISLEASTMFFLITYAFSMCALSVAALSFPLTMHITLKEYRNGWYSMSSYVLAKTIANIPFETIFPMLSLCIAYPLLGHPDSYLQWRMMTIALVMAFISMIANAQGLIFGAIFMDSVQSATFMANASTLPLVLLSGFTARISHMPVWLQYVSWGSMYKYASDAISIVRFGFGQCPCDKELDKYIREVSPRLKGIPDQMRSMFNFYIVNGMSDNGNSNNEEDDFESASAALDKTTTTISPSSLADIIANNVTTIFSDMTTTTMSPPLNSGEDEVLDRASLVRSLLRSDQVITINNTVNEMMIKRIEKGELDVFQELANLFARALAFGQEINSCEDVRSQLLKTGIPPDSYLPYIFGCMVSMLIILRLVLFFVIKFKIHSRL